MVYLVTRGWETDYILGVVHDFMAQILAQSKKIQISRLQNFSPARLRGPLDRATKFFSTQNHFGCLPNVIT